MLFSTSICSHLDITNPAFVLYWHSPPAAVIFVFAQHGAPGAIRMSYRNSVRASTTLSSIQAIISIMGMITLYKGPVEKVAIGMSVILSGYLSVSIIIYRF